MARKSTGDYPENWEEIAKAVKDAVGWKCVHCAWWNIPALCQRCHLKIQNKVVMERQWMFEHSEWFKPYVAGYYARQFGKPEDKLYVLAHLDELLRLGRSW